MITMDNVRQRWIDVYDTALPFVIHKCAIPLEIDHAKYQAYMAGYLNDVAAMLRG